MERIKCARWPCARAAEFAFFWLNVIDVYNVVIVDATFTESSTASHVCLLVCQFYARDPSSVAEMPTIPHFLIIRQRGQVPELV